MAAVVMPGFCKRGYDFLDRTQNQIFMGKAGVSRNLVNTAPRAALSLLDRYFALGADLAKARGFPKRALETSASAKVCVSAFLPTFRSGGPPKPKYWAIRGKLPLPIHLRRLPSRITCAVYKPYR